VDPAYRHQSAPHPPLSLSFATQWGRVVGAGSPHPRAPLPSLPRGPTLLGTELLPPRTHSLSALWACIVSSALHVPAVDQCARTRACHRDPRPRRPPTRPYPFLSPACARTHSPASFHAVPLPLALCSRRQVGGVSSIQASSMAVTFKHKINLHPGYVFCFGTISSVADEEGTLHRIADPPERKSSSKISERIGAKQGKAQPPAPQEKITFSKLGAEGSSTRRTPLSTSPTEEWTRITRRKEANEVKGRQAALSVPSPSKENRKKIVATAAPSYPDVLFIGGRVESNPISDDEPTAPGEEPLHRESRRRRKRRRNIRRHHEAGEQDPAQPVSRDEVSEVGETLEERVLRERRNS
jgi:hypothetical protein